MSLKSSGSITLVDLSELVTYELSSSVAAVMKDVNKEGALSAPSIIFTPKKYVGDNLQENFSGYIYVEYISEEGTEAESGFGTSFETTKLEDGTSFTEIQAVLYEDISATNELARKQIFIIETGKNGTPGAGYSIFLSNDSYVFPGTEEGAILDYIVSVKLEIYKNTIPLELFAIKAEIDSVELTLSSDTDLILNEEIKVSENNTSAIFSFKVNKTFTESGTILISCYADTMNFSKNFNYGVALRGESAENISAITPYYALGDSIEAPPSEPSLEETSGWSLERPVVGDKFLWCSYFIQFTNNNFTFTEPFYVPSEADILQSSEEPSSPVEGMLWLDTSVTPYQLQRYKEATETSPAEWILIADYQNDISSILERVSETETKINKQDENITFQASKIEETQTNLQTFSSQVTSLLEMDINGASLIFSDIRQSISDADVSKTDFYKDLTTFFDFDLTGLTIGRNDSNMLMHLSNEKLSFLTNNTEVAYFDGSDNRLYISDGSFINSINIGNYTWILESNGGLSLVYNPEKTNTITE